MDKILRKLGDDLLNKMTDERGSKDTIMWLLNSGYATEELKELGFSTEEIEEKRLEYMKMARNKDTENVIPNPDVCGKVLVVDEWKDVKVLVDSLTSDEATQILIQRTGSVFDTYALSVADNAFSGEYFEGNDSVSFEFTGLESTMKFVSVMVKYQEVVVSTDGAFRNLPNSERSLVVRILKDTRGKFKFSNEY